MRLSFLPNLFFFLKQKRYKRLKKLKPIDSDEEDDDRASVGGHSADEREALAHELFEDDDIEQPPVCCLHIVICEANKCKGLCMIALCEKAIIMSQS